MELEERPKTVNLAHRFLEEFLSLTKVPNMLHEYAS